MQVVRRVQVESVEIAASRVGPVVAARHAVRIQHRYQFEDVESPEEDCDRVVLLHEQV